MKSVTSAHTPRIVRDGRSSRWDQHRRERRLELVRAARAAVHELGPDASMDDIAAHVGTSKSVFYRYFGDRGGLRAAVAERVTAHMERRLLEAADDATDPAATLHRMVEVYLSVAATSPHVYAFAVSLPESEAGSGRADVLDAFFDRIYAVLEAGLARHLGSDRSGLAGAPVHLWPRAAVGLVRGSAETWLAAPEGERVDVERMAAAISGWLLHGVLGEPAGSAPTPPPSSPCADPDTTRAPDRRPVRSTPSKERSDDHHAP